MRLVTFEHGTKSPAAGVVHNDFVFDLSDIAPNMVEFLALDEPGWSKARQRMSGKATCKLGDVKLLAPLLNPPKILCLAGNYQKHVTETGRKAKEKSRVTPFLFMKPTTTIIGPGDGIRHSKMTDQLDWELELGVVIGKTAKNVPEEKALDVVAGYTVTNDISSRHLLHGGEVKDQDWQRFYDWLMGKWQDTSLPMGPWIVTKDEIPDPQNLHLLLSVNGVVKQDGNTSEMIHSVPEIIAFASRLLTLQPGDIICTGTPAGVGKARGEFLKAGDKVLSKIEGIGEIENAVVGE
ncbi:MAG: FAA hydrolase family protein [Verrucomicrobiae bacterium]|nr:FAA hydrolase family protein [Verrucomicrobiae bacterium]